MKRSVPSPNERLEKLVRGYGITPEAIMQLQRQTARGGYAPRVLNLLQYTWGPATILALLQLVLEADRSARAP